MSLKGKTRTRQARCDVLKAHVHARQRALARARAKFDRRQYDGHGSEEIPI
jgi:hypothetical protein